MLFAKLKAWLRSDDPCSSENFQLEKSSLSLDDKPPPQSDTFAGDRPDRSSIEAHSSKVSRFTSMTQDTSKTELCPSTRNGLPQSGCRSHFMSCSGVLILLVNALISLAVSVFIAPRIPCHEFPSFLSRYCPPETAAVIASTTHYSTQDNDDLSSLITTRHPQIRNLALSSHGAFLVKDLTRLGRLSTDRVGWIRRAFRVVHWTASTTDLNALSVVLDESTVDDRCWEGDGDQVQIAIRLTSFAPLERITVYCGTLSCRQGYAPREIIVWGMIDGHANIRRLEESPDIYRTIRERARSAPPLHGRLVNEHMFLPIATFTFEPQRDRLVESPIFDEVQNLGIEFGVVVIQILSNWGARHTHLCRIGVFERNDISQRGFT